MWTPPREQPLWEQPGAENSGPEWLPGAYSPRTKYAYIPSGGYSPWLYRSSAAEVNSYGSTGTPPAVPKLKTYGMFNAVDTVTGKIGWRKKTSGIVVSGTVVAVTSSSLGSTTAPTKPTTHRRERLSGHDTSR